MRIKMKIGVSGTRGDDVEWPRVGGEITVPDAEAMDLISAGHATAVKDEPKVETATAKTDDVETAAAEVEEKSDGPLTTDSGPVKRGPGRPPKNSK